MAENPEAVPADDTAAATPPPPPPPLPDPAPDNPASEGDPGAVNSAEAVGLPAAASAEQPAPLKELTLEEKGKLRKERFRLEKEAEKERIRLEEEAELKRLRLEDERIRLEEKVEFERIQLEEERIRLEEKRTRLDEEAELERIGLETCQRRLEQEEQARMEASRLRVIIEATIEEVVGLKHENAEVQRRVVNLQKRRKSVHADQFILEGQDTFYKSCLTDWAETRYEFNKIKHIYDKKIDSLRGRLQKKQYEANTRLEEMINYIYKIARCSADIISRKGIQRHVLLELEHEERDTLMEMQIVRTRGRQLKCQLEKLQSTLALKDQLQLDSGNLHLVDYEQLKIEIELLNEKFHLKNKALSALRKKRTQSVHLLQHIREKLHFLATECKEKREQLARNENALHGGRMKLSFIESSILAENRKGEAVQKNIVYIKSPIIMDDMDNVRENLEEEEKNFEDLNNLHYDLTVKIQQYKNRLRALRVSKPHAARAFIGARPRTPCRWGNRREVLGHTVIQNMTRMMTKQSATKRLMVP